MKLKDELCEMGACAGAIQWVGNRDLADAWGKCERADWMLWYLAEKGVNRRLLVLCACACAETALRYIPAPEDRPRQAIEIARAWVHGKAPLDVVHTTTRAVLDIIMGAPRRRSAASAAVEATASAIYTVLDPVSGSPVTAAYTAALAAELGGKQTRKSILAVLADLVRATVHEWEKEHATFLD